jgi:hypothetical protein
MLRKIFFSLNHHLIKLLSSKGETYPEVASASPPPVRENGADSRSVSLPLEDTENFLDEV